MPIVVRDEDGRGALRVQHQARECRGGLPFRAARDGLQAEGRGEGGRREGEGGQEDEPGAPRAEACG